MRVSQVIGKVVLSRRHAALKSGTLLIAASFSLEGLQARAAQLGQQAERQLNLTDVAALPGRGEPFVVFDELGAGLGELIAVSEGVEAAAPFAPQQMPIDAYNAAILDTLELE